MSRRLKTIALSAFAAFLLLILFAGSVFVWRAVDDRRSVPGRVLRWVLGESGAHQTVNDLAEDIRESQSLAPLQQWSIDTLHRFRSGDIHKNGESPYWAVGNVRLPPEEIPSFIRDQWGDSAVVSVLVADDGQPEAVVIEWYLFGIIAGPPEYQLSIKPWCSAQVMPGVYAYHLYK